MNINGKLTICERDDFVEIEIMDDASRLTFVRAQVSHKSLVKAMARMACVNLNTCEVNGLDKVGKIMEHKTLKFEITQEVASAWKTREKEAGKMADKLCPEGWESDSYFGSQGSFSAKDGKNYATCTIRRWV